MARFMAPTRYGVRTLRSPGEKQTAGVYDSTAIYAGDLAANFITGNTMNPATMWFDPYMSDANGKRRKDAVAEWLEESRDRMMAQLANSLYYAEASESMIDYLVFGTHSLIGEEAPALPNQDKGGFRGYYWHADRIGRFAISEGPDGMVDTNYRLFRGAARTFAARFGLENMSDGVRAQIANQGGDRFMDMIHAIEPRPMGEQRRGSLAKSMPITSAWVERESKHVVKEGGYSRFPSANSRYRKTPGEVYGRGRGEIAFPDTRTGNRAMQMSFEDWSLKIRPPVLTRHDSVIGSLRLVPGGNTSVRTVGGPPSDSVQAFQTGSHPEVSQIMMADIRAGINRAFYVDQLIALMEVQKTEMTAFEYAKKIELLFRILGPVYANFEHSFLGEVVDIAWQVGMEGGLFSDPPEEIYETDGTIEVEFNNPIARAQKAGDVEAIQLAINDMAPLAEIDPSIFDRLDMDGLVDTIFDVRGVPAKAQRGEDEVAQIRQQRAQQAQEQQMMAEAGAVAEGLNKTAPMVSALSDAGVGG